MAQYKFVVFSDASSGRATEYEHWYVNMHIPQVLDVPGFISGQQHRVCNAVNTGLPPVGPSYMALYEIETDDPQAATRDIAARSGTSMLQSPVDINLASIKSIFVEPIGGLLTN